MSEISVESPIASSDSIFFNDSRLFILRPLYYFNTEKCTFCQNGRKKIFAGVSNNAFFFYLMESDEKKSIKEIPWDSKKYSVIDLCFDPSGTWLLVLSPTTLQIVPVLPLLEPDVKHDLRWPTNKITTITLNPNHARDPSAIVWWQTKDSQQIVIIGDKGGDLVFFSLETLEIIGKTCVVGGVHKLTIFLDDPLDTVTLLITSNKNRQWKLLLEQRLSQYNWITGKKEQRKNKDLNLNFDEFFASIKELGSNKMSTLFQTKSPTVADIPTKLSTPVNRCNPTPISMEHHLEPCTSKSQTNDEQGVYPPTNLSHWIVSPQNADGRHFISFFNSVHGTFTLQKDVDDRKPVFTFKVEGLPSDVHTVLWQHKIIFAFGMTVVQVHSSALASQQDANLYTLIWEDDLCEGEHVVAAWGIENSAPFPAFSRKWIESDKIEDLDLPRFALNSCIVATNKKTYLLTTRCNPCEWLVAQLVSGRRGVERTAAALGMKLHHLLMAAADVLLVQRSIPQAIAMYKLAKVGSDEPLSRCGALGLYNEMLSSGFTPQSVSTGNIYFMAHVLVSMVMYQDDTDLINYIQSNTQFSVPECLALCADLGLWNAISKISFGKGMFWMSFQSLVQRISTPCRGLWGALLHKPFSPFIICDAAMPLMKYIEQYYESFDDYLLKNLCIWMSPLQDCYYIVYKALCTSQPNGYLSGMKRLIRIFFGVLSTIYSRMQYVTPETLIPNENSINELSSTAVKNNNPEANRAYPTTISAGHTHWGVTHNGKVQIKHMDSSLGYLNVDLDLFGRAISVACGRNHTLLLTDNGLYALGDNQFGQLGVGSNIRYSQDTFILIGVMGGNMPNKKEFYWKNEIITYVTAGQYHSACITDQGALYTWGWGVHGQLAHGTIFDEHIPKKVITLKSEKVISVGCGACHTSILTKSGKILVCGSGAFGQIGHSDRHKCNLPYEVNLGPSPVTKIAVGYFHTLALTAANEVWCWGSSPQSLRVGARGARRSKGFTKDDEGQQKDNGEQLPPSPTPVDENPHLYPSKVNISNVNGKIVKMSAGWHHSCIVDEFGKLYVWGLNLDGQLGSGDQKEILIPTHVEIPNVEDNKTKSPPKSIFVNIPTGNASYHHTKDCYQQKHSSHSSKSLKKKEPVEPKPSSRYLADVECGSDFTIYLNLQGKLFIAGNSYQQFQDVNVKGALHIVKLKNTKRILRLPNSRSPAQKMFRHFILPNNILETTYVNVMESSYERISNPMSSMEDFENPQWALNTLSHLHRFIDDDTPLLDIHLRSQLAILRKDYSEALSLKLNALFVNTVHFKIPLYYQHDDIDIAEKQDYIKEIILERIKKQSRNLLGCEYTDNVTNPLCCLCEESDYLFSKQKVNPKEKAAHDITKEASLIVKSILKVLPQNSNIWSECVNQATLFWIDNELNMSDLEKILSEVVNEGHVINMASAIFCNKENIDYQKHLSPAFNLELCDTLLKYW